jgi:CMP-N,N'-diacetyllegionaminic acid synthase
MNVLGLVPARGGSKRVPRKNVRLLGGVPVVVRTLEAARGAQCLRRVLVTSDDDEVLALASAIDPACALRRPAELSTDAAPAIDYVRHAIAWCERQGGPRIDVVVVVQPSSPLTLPADIDATVALLEKTGADTAVTVMQLDHAIHPVKLKTLAGDRLLPYFEEERGRMATAQLPVLYVRNCAVYATRRRVIDAGQIIGPDCRGHVMPRERSVDINDELDFRFAEFLFDSRTPPEG